MSDQQNQMPAETESSLRQQLNEARALADGLRGLRYRKGPATCGLCGSSFEPSDEVLMGKEKIPCPVCRDGAPKEVRGDSFEARFFAVWFETAVRHQVQKAVSVLAEQVGVEIWHNGVSWQCRSKPEPLSPQKTLVFTVAKNLGLSPREVETWTDDQIREAVAFLEIEQKEMQRSR